MNYQETLLRLRLLVGFLGEGAQFGWYSSAFFDPSSQSFLAPVFTKTVRSAQYHGVLEASRILHDEHLNVGTYHLFRLPEEIEQDLYTRLKSMPPDELHGCFPQNLETALDELATMSGNTDEFNEGPAAIGSIKELESTRILRRVAGAYNWAFSNDKHVYPYLTP